MHKYNLAITALCLSLVSGATLAADEWKLDPALSQLNFISVKKNNIAESNQFKTLEAQVDSQGVLTLNIDLASVDTANPVRDDRMKKHLFEVDSFATATVTATVESDFVDAISEGASEQLTVDAVLELRGESKPLQIDVIITRLVGAKLSVVTAKPVIINAGDFALVAGVDKLMELAKLPSISHAVPVTFYLTFRLKRD